MPVTIVGSNTPTAGGVVYGDGTSYASTAAGTSGQVLTSNGAAAPTWNAPAVVNLATGVTGTLPVANGGTNLTSYTTGDIVYASASGTLASLADVATGNALISGGVGVAPSYGKIGLTTHVSGTLPVANGGTGSTTLTANNVLLGNGTSALQVVAPGSSGNLLTSNGTTWASSAPAAVNLATGVTGTLGVANGGTGSTSLTANNVLLGNGTSAVQVVAPGSSGNVLTSNGTTWQSTAPAGGGSWVYLTGVDATAGSATVDVDYAFSTTYDMYVIVAEGVRSNANPWGLVSRFKYGGVVNTSAGYQYTITGNSSTTMVAQTGSSNTSFTLSDGNIWTIGISAGVSGSFVLFYPYAANTSAYKAYYGQVYAASNSNPMFCAGGQFSVTTALSGIRFYASSGSLYGYFRLYGIKNS